MTVAVDTDPRAAWRRWRRGGLGGSDVAQLVPGLSPWGSPYALWWDKTGLADWTDEPSEAMRWGSLLEDTILDEFTVRTGLTVVGRQSWFEHPQARWARCTPDGFATEGVAGDGDLGAGRPSSAGSPGKDGDPAPGTGAGARVPIDTPPAGAIGVVQAKTSGWPADWADGAVPDHIAAQVQWEMFVTGLDMAWVPVLLQGRRLHIAEVPRDDAAIRWLVQIAETFWFDHVEAREPPPVDGTEATSLALADAYRAAAVGVAVPLDDLAPLVDELRTLRDERRVLDGQLRAAENIVKQALGPAEIGTVDGVDAVTWKETRSRRVDLDALAVDHPDLVDRYRTETVSRRLLVKKGVAA